MSDDSNITGGKPKGMSKGIVGSIMVPLIAHYHAQLVGALTAHYPIIDAFAGELLVASAESFIGGSAVHWTPDSILASIIAFIRWTKDAVRKIIETINSKN